MKESEPTSVMRDQRAVASSIVERITLGRMQNPVRGFLHGGAALFSVAGLITLAVRTAWNTPRMWSMIVFGVSLIALYTTSSLYHSVPWREEWRPRMQRLDHSMILVLVAGSWTPLAVNALQGSWRITTLSIVWGLALVGILQKIFIPRVRVWFSITLATVMGWFALVPLPQLLRNLAIGAVVLMFVSGAFYTVGMVAFATKRPQLFPRIFSYHEVFHVLVVAGSVTHFVLLMLYVVPLPA